MALLLTPVFGVTGCGSDENTQLETEITQLETEITQLETEISQFEARVDALEEQAGSRVTNLTLDPTDDDVQFQSRSKNAAPEPTEVPEAPEASGVSDAPSEADCDRRKEFIGSYDFHRTLSNMNLDQRHSYDSLLDDLELLEELELHDDLDLDDLDRLDRVYYKLLEYIEFLDDLAPLHEIRNRLAKCDVPDDWDLAPPGPETVYEGGGG